MGTTFPSLCRPWARAGCLCDHSGRVLCAVCCELPISHLPLLIFRLSLFTIHSPPRFLSLSLLSFVTHQVSLSALTIVAAIMHLPALALSLVASVLASPLNTHVIHEKRDAAPNAWVKRDAVPQDMLLPMRIGLKSPNIDKGHDFLLDVSTPGSPNYGKHWTVDEVNDMFAASPESYDAIHKWLVSSGIPRHTVSLSANKGWVQFDTKAEDAEDLLKTRFHFFEHDSGDANIACDEYSVPEHLSKHIDYITPGVNLLTNGHKQAHKLVSRGLVKRGQVGKGHNGRMPAIVRAGGPERAPAPGDLSNCSLAITPDCITALYQIPPFTSTPHPDNSLGIFEYGDIYLQSDLNTYWERFYPKIPTGTAPTFVSIDGGNDTYGFPLGEADLDVQISWPIIYPQNVTVFNSDDIPTAYKTVNPLQGLFNNFLSYLDSTYCTSCSFGECGDDPAYDGIYPDKSNLTGAYKGQLQCGVSKPTNVISISYGAQEYDLTANYQRRQCQEFMKLGLQGVTIIVASGDNGVAGYIGADGNANGCLPANSTDPNIFSPSGPLCPYLTSVGSTYIPSNGSVATGEVATTRFKSAGGFSNIYPRPEWQDDAVQAYFDNAPVVVQDLPYYNTTELSGIGANGGLYNRGGRAFPDIAAIGDNIPIYRNGRSVMMGGTSASAPVVAAMITRINEERLANNMPTLGFISPTLYKYPQMFNDITVGDNFACNGKGFVATKGWDPVTGLGTPNYLKMLYIFMILGMESQEASQSGPTGYGK